MVSGKVRRDSRKGIQIFQLSAIEHLPKHFLESGYMQIVLPLTFSFCIFFDWNLFIFQECWIIAVHFFLSFSMFITTWTNILLVMCLHHHSDRYWKIRWREHFQDKTEWKKEERIISRSTWEHGISQVILAISMPPESVYKHMAHLKKRIGERNKNWP